MQAFDDCVCTAGFHRFSSLVLRGGKLTLK